MTPSFTDQQIIDAFRAGGPVRESAWEFAYKEWRGKVLRVVIDRGGTREEALEAINGTVKDFEARLCQPSFVLENKLSTFFVTCVKNEWLRMQKKKKMDSAVQSADQDFLERTADKNSRETLEEGAEIARAAELEALIDSTLSRIGERCKTILLMFMNRYSMQAIAEKMGFPGGEQVAKNEKRKCQVKYETFLREQPLILKHIQLLRNG